MLLNLAGQNALPFSFTFLLRPIIIRIGIDTAVELFLCSPVKSKKYIQATKISIQNLFSGENGIDSAVKVYIV